MTCPFSRIGRAAQGGVLHPGASMLRQTNRQEQAPPPHPPTHPPTHSALFPSSALQGEGGQVARPLVARGRHAPAAHGGAPAGLGELGCCSWDFAEGLAL